MRFGIKDQVRFGQPTSDQVRERVREQNYVSEDGGGERKMEEVEDRVRKDEVREVRRRRKRGGEEEARKRQAADLEKERK